jgi:hypothetical protein
MLSLQRKISFMETPNFIESYQTNEFDFCDKVIDKLEEYLKIDTTAIMIGSQTNNGQANRVDYSVNFEALQDPLNVEMHQILNKYIVEYVNKYTGYAQRNAISRTMKVQKTPPKGGFHTWHSEHSSNNNSSYRVLTWTLYLNDIPEGEGETEFLEYGIKVQPVKGSLCFFSSSLDTCTQRKSCLHKNKIHSNRLVLFNIGENNGEIYNNIQWWADW